LLSAADGIRVEEWVVEEAGVDAEVESEEES
jgi:hypothetical protein